VVKNVGANWATTAAADSVIVFAVCSQVAPIVDVMAEASAGPIAIAAAVAAIVVRDVAGSVFLRLNPFVWVAAIVAVVTCSQDSADSRSKAAVRVAKPVVTPDAIPVVQTVADERALV